MIVRSRPTVLHVCAEESGEKEGQIIDADIELNGATFRLSVGDPVASRGFDDQHPDP